jgi:hypothetical protein
MASKPQKQRKLQPLRAEASWTVDPLSDLVSAQELAAWRRDVTTEKVLRYLARFRAQLVEQLAEGASTESTVEATAMRTVEYVSKAQLLKDVLTLEPKDLADFYGVPPLKEGKS